jgi:hypothetical protein
MGRTLTKDIDNNEQEKEAEIALDDKRDELFYAMLNGQTVTDTIKTSRGDFIVKFPKQKDIISIGRIAAFMRSGIPATNFDAVSEYEIQKVATLDIMITSGPAWFENARKKNKGFSWRDVPDAHFVDEVYAKALQFRQGVQDDITGDQKAAAEKPDGENAADVSADVGDGVFQGASGSAKRTGH